MSYSEPIGSAWLKEQRQEIERQHAEIIDLKGQVIDLREERKELTAVIDAQTTDLKDTERELNGLSEAISSAIEDLRVLGEVPLGQLEESIKAIADRLADKNGDRY